MLLYYSNHTLWIACSYHHADVMLISSPDLSQHDTIGDEQQYLSIFEFYQTQMEVKQNAELNKQATQVTPDAEQRIPSLEEQKQGRCHSKTVLYKG